jgi:prevent-host-death family protein
MHGKTVSATEARIHFGEVLRSAQDGPVVVERQGRALAVVLSKELYDELTARARASWQDLAARVREMVVRDRAGDPLPDPARVLRAEREPQDERHGLR